MVVNGGILMLWKIHAKWYWVHLDQWPTSLGILFPEWKRKHNIEDSEITEANKWSVKLQAGGLSWEDSRYRRCPHCYSVSSLSRPMRDVAISCWSSALVKTIKVTLVTVVGLDTCYNKQKCKLWGTMKSLKMRNQGRLLIAFWILALLMDGINRNWTDPVKWEVLKISAIPLKYMSLYWIAIWSVGLCYNLKLMGLKKLVC